MDWTPPPSGSVLAFVGICAAVCGMFLWGVWASSEAHVRRALLGLGVWLALTGALPASGVLELGFPALVAFMVGCNLSALALGLTPLGRALSGLPIAALIGAQAFRLPLEIVLHAWGDAGTIPTSMTWSGQNLDVITGVAAVGLGLGAWVAPARARLFGGLFSVIGLGLLLNVARVAVLSAPGPLRAFGDPPLMVAYHFPFVWIVPVCVAGALLGHVVLLRRLLGR